VEVLNKVVALNLDIHLWSARKKLRKEDLKRIQSDQIPPPEVASLGSKKICDPKEIAIFDALKRRASRACSAVGVRFLGGYAIPQDKVPDLIKELDEIGAEFDRHKSQFIKRYDAIVGMWIASHPQWEAVIRRSITPVKQVESAISFGYQAFRVAPVSGSEDQEDSLIQKTSGLADRLFFEVATQAEKTLEESFKGKATVTRRAIRPLIAIREKLDGLSFLDARVTPVMTWIEELLDKLPKSGPIEGSALMGIESALVTLSSPDRIKALGESRLFGESATEESVQDSDFADDEEAIDPAVENQLDAFFDGEEETGDDLSDFSDLIPDESKQQEESLWFYV
jgi:hypothetical protein